MMFVCKKCNRQTKPNEKMSKSIVEKRNKVYNNGSIGREIVKEIDICTECHDKP